jgi:L-aspartate oxidase
MEKTDFLVIGSGIAGLSYAIKTAEKFPDKKVIVATKSTKGESNTQFAQGGIAAVTDLKNDSFQQHIQDTLIAGGGLCKPEIVSMVVQEAPERVYELIQWGVEFDKDQHGYHLGLEGGHSQHRILHHKDITGAEIQRALIKKASMFPNIELRTNLFALELLMKPHAEPGNETCQGAFFMDTSICRITKVLAKITLIATGGCGQVYQCTTNPLIATGDGIAMAARAGAVTENMEFIQFHPTALFLPNESPSFLISEAVRGMGAILLNHQQERFMEKYDTRGSLAPRDVVARAVQQEMHEAGKPNVFLDARHINVQEFVHHFPNIYEKCKSIGIDIEKDLIPVCPAAHYMCGGIKVDEFGQTSIKNLYACGESACSGLHGANRLASNSLLEAVVYAHRIYKHTALTIDQIDLNNPMAVWYSTCTSQAELKNTIKHYRKEVKKLMSRKAGIVRSRVLLRELQASLKDLKGKTEEILSYSSISQELYELHNLITVSLLITNSALKRKKSIGLHTLLA